jgi:hypothetical protein
MSRYFSFGAGYFGSRTRRRKQNLVLSVDGEAGQVATEDLYSGPPQILIMPEAGDMEDVLKEHLGTEYVYPELPVGKFMDTDEIGVLIGQAPTVLIASYRQMARLSKPFRSLGTFGYKFGVILTWEPKEVDLPQEEKDAVLQDLAEAYIDVTEVLTAESLFMVGGLEQIRQFVRQIACRYDGVAPA